MRFLAEQTVRQPLTLMRDTPAAARELLRIALGKSEVAPGKTSQELKCQAATED